MVRVGELWLTRNTSQPIYEEDHDLDPDETTSRLYNTGYLETVGLENIHAFAKRPEDFMIYCSVVLLPLSDSKNLIECGDFIDIVPVFNPTYPTCYRVQMSKHKRQELMALTGKFVAGYKLIVYTGAFNETLQWEETDTTKIIDDYNGVVFAVHNNNNIPPSTIFHYLAPGFEHAVNVKPSIRQRLPRDGKDSCIEDNDVERHFYGIYSGSRIRYDTVSKPEKASVKSPA